MLSAAFIKYIQMAAKTLPSHWSLQNLTISENFQLKRKEPYETQLDRKLCPDVTFHHTAAPPEAFSST